MSTITVTVRNEDGDPLQGAAVTLQATGDDNTLTQPGGTTGSDGRAIGTLGSAAPGNKVISATVNGSVRLSQTAEVAVTAPPARIEPIEGNNQTVPAGFKVPVRPTVRVADGLGLPVEGIEVTFVVTGGGGSVDGADQTTNADGIARVREWTLGSEPGGNTLEARAGSLQGSPVVFSAEGIATGGVDRFVFRVQPRDVAVGERFSVEVVMVDPAGDVVPLSGIEIYLGLFREGEARPSNGLLLGFRIRDTESGVAVFDGLAVTKEGRYRFRALTDELPPIGVPGPDPYLFSEVFEVD